MACHSVGTISKLFHLCKQTNHPNLTLWKFVLFFYALPKVFSLCNRSGIEEECSEPQQLLHDIHVNRRDRLELDNKKKREKQEKEKTEKEKGEQMRAAALVGMASEFVFSLSVFSWQVKMHVIECKPFSIADICLAIPEIKQILIS